jgi:hypothetical protein
MSGIVPLKADVFAVSIEKYRFLTLILYALLLIPPSTIIHNDIFFYRIGIGTVGGQIKLGQK